jgi:hypothetical protein
MASFGNGANDLGAVQALSAATAPLGRVKLYVVGLVDPCQGRPGSTGLLARPPLHPSPL